MSCDEVDRLKRRVDELERKLCDRRCDCKCCKCCNCRPMWQYYPGYVIPYYPQATGTFTDYNGTQYTYTVQSNSTQTH